MRAHKGEMKVTSAELRSKIERYRELIRSLGAKNLARGRLQTLIDKMENKLRNGIPPSACDLDQTQRVQFVQAGHI